MRDKLKENGEKGKLLNCGSNFAGFIWLHLASLMEMITANQ